MLYDYDNLWKMTRIHKKGLSSQLHIQRQPLHAEGCCFSDSSNSSQLLNSSLNCLHHMPHLHGAPQYHNFPSQSFQHSCSQSMVPGPRQGLVIPDDQNHSAGPGNWLLTSLMCPLICSQNSLKDKFPYGKVSRTMVKTCGSGLCKTTPPWLCNHEWVT